MSDQWRETTAYAILEEPQLGQWFYISKKPSGDCEARTWTNQTRKFDTLEEAKQWCEGLILPPPGCCG
jgi:hypothetical protein